MKKEKMTILYGAGGGGSIALRKLLDEGVSIDYVSDGAADKWGGALNGVPIVSPQFFVDEPDVKIYIASGKYAEIFDQLVEWGVDRESIVVLPVHYIVERAFYDLNDTDFPTKVLVELIRFLDRQGIGYWLDFGTLLGICRDRELIPWDYDVDISMDGDPWLKALELAKNGGPLLADSSIIVEHELDYPNDEGFTMQYVNALGDPVYVDFYRRMTKGNQSYVNTEIRSDKYYYADLKHFQRSETVSCLGLDFKTPWQWERYLTGYYGNWKTPDKMFWAQ